MDTNTIDRILTLDTTVGVTSKNALAKQLGKAEGTIRAAYKAVQRIIPEASLLVDGRLTELAVELVRLCLERSGTIEEWSNELHLALKDTDLIAPPENSIELDFLAVELGHIAATSTALVLSGQTTMQTLQATDARLAQIQHDINQARIKQAFERGYQSATALIEAELKGQQQARKEYIEAQRKNRST